MDLHIPMTLSVTLFAWGRFLKGEINYTRHNNYSRDKSAMPGITGVINLSQIYSLHRAIPSFRNRSYSRYKVIPGITHTYAWNRVILPFRNRPLVVIWRVESQLDFAVFAHLAKFPCLCTGYQNLHGYAMVAYA